MSSDSGSKGPASDFHPAPPSETVQPTVETAAPQQGVYLVSTYLFSFPSDSRSQSRRAARRRRTGHSDYHRAARTEGLVQSEGCWICEGEREDAPCPSLLLIYYITLIQEIRGMVCKCFPSSLQCLHSIIVPC